MGKLRKTALPRRLKALFWDHDFARMTWRADRDLIIGRILAVGDWDSACWLRRRLPDAQMQDWLASRGGAGLSDRHLRFWEIVLRLPRRQVNAWLTDPARVVWEGRCQGDRAHLIWERR
jgi:hypothetical protein